MLDFRSPPPGPAQAHPFWDFCSNDDISAIIRSAGRPATAMACTAGQGSSCGRRPPRKQRPGRRSRQTQQISATPGRRPKAVMCRSTYRLFTGIFFRTPQAVKPERRRGLVRGRRPLNGNQCRLPASLRSRPLRRPNPGSRATIVFQRRLPLVFDAEPKWFLPRKVDRVACNAIRASIRVICRTAKSTPAGANKSAPAGRPAPYSRTSVAYDVVTPPTPGSSSHCAPAPFLGPYWAARPPFRLLFAPMHHRRKKTKKERKKHAGGVAGRRRHWPDRASLRGLAVVAHERARPRQSNRGPLFWPIFRPANRGVRRVRNRPTPALRRCVTSLAGGSADSHQTGFAGPACRTSPGRPLWSRLAAIATGFRPPLLRFDVTYNGRTGARPEQCFPPNRCDRARLYTVPAIPPTRFLAKRWPVGSAGPTPPNLRRAQHARAGPCGWAQPGR